MTRVAAKAGAVTRHFRSFLRRRTRDFVLKNAEIGSCLLFFVFSLLVEKKAEDETKMFKASPLVPSFHARR